MNLNNKIYKKNIAINYHGIKDGKEVILESIRDISNASEYINNNWQFMNEGSIYPNILKYLEIKYISERTREPRIQFNRGLIRNLNNLINNGGDISGHGNIFGDGNIVLLFSCADANSRTKPDHIKLAKQISIDEQNRKKYLKYKQKYLNLKKKLKIN